MVVAHPVIDQLVNASNAKDAVAVSTLFSFKASLYDNAGQLIGQTRQDLFAYYTNLFAIYPENQTQVLHRVTTGNRVIDYERVQRGVAYQPVEMISIYDLDADGLICRLEWVRNDDLMSTV